MNANRQALVLRGPWSPVVRPASVRNCLVLFRSPERQARRAIFGRQGLGPADSSRFRVYTWLTRRDQPGGPVTLSFCLARMPACRRLRPPLRECIANDHRTLDAYGRLPPEHGKWQIGVSPGLRVLTRGDPSPIFLGQH